MSTRSKDGIIRTCTCCNKYELRAINFVVQRRSILDPIHPDLSIKRDLENPEDLIVHIKHGEGQRPIFDRDDVRVNEEREIILTDSKQSCLKENEDNEQNQYYSESSEGNNSFDRENLQEDSIPSHRPKKRSRSRECRSISPENCETFFKSNRSPNCRNICSSENAVLHHIKYSRSTSCTRSFRSKSPCTSDRYISLKRRSSYCESSREYERYKKRSKHYSRSPSPFCGKENLREDSSSSNRSGNGRSHSRERGIPENSFRSSCKFPYKSENVHKSLKRKFPYRESSREYERNEKRSRRYNRSLSPSHKRSRRYNRSLSSYKDRSGNRSPSPHERYRRSHSRRSPSPNKYKRSHRDDRYSTRSPSYYKRGQYYPNLQPHLGSINYGPQ